MPFPKWADAADDCITGMPRLWPSWPPPQSTHTPGTGNDAGTQGERPSVAHNDNSKSKNLQSIALVQRQRLANFLVDDDTANHAVAPVWIA